jgi:hypothetical protein
MADAKNIYEQLEELKEQLNEANKPRTLDEQLANNDPAVIEFVKNAKRVWRYYGERSDFNRKLKAIRKRGIILLILLALQIAIPFLLVSVPYVWILISINTMFCIGYGVYSGYNFFKKREYEIPYDQTCGLGQYNEYDDNNVIISTENGFWLKAFKLFTLSILPLSIFVFSFFGLMVLLGLASIGGWIAFLLSGLIFPLSAARFSDSGMDYVLYFVDDKNEIKYHLLKDFIKRNNLQ